MKPIKIDLDKIRETLNELKNRDETQKGMQPEMILGCFMSLHRRDTSYCQECRLYEGCIRTLAFYEIKKPLFKKYEI
jgi:hypothetical protein